MELRPPWKLIAATLIVLLCGPAGLGVAHAFEAGNFEAEFQATQRLCDAFFLPNSMARPTGFDLQGHMHEIEAQLRNRAARFRSAEGIAYLRSHRESDSDDISHACAEKLLEFATATPANPRVEPTSDSSNAAARGSSR